jgi:hypothetical protein
MDKTMYEINWHSVGEIFSHCTVTPITVIREGVLPGCMGVSITAIASDGHKFIGSPQNYYHTEEAAWAAAKEELAKSIEAHEKELTETHAQLTAQREFLATIKDYLIVGARTKGM